MLNISGMALAASAIRPALAADAIKDNTDRRLKILVAGAHPDDPESGCGGTILRYTDMGHKVVSLYLTRGEAGIPGKTHQEAADIRSSEAKAACKIMKARPLFAGQIDGSTEITAKRYSQVAEIIAAEKPDIVFTHWPVDSHRDHRICSLLVYDAWNILENSFSLYYFEVMTGNQSQNFFPTHYVDITSTVERKHKACFAHKSQNPESFYKEDHGPMEKFRGNEYGCDYAEAFIHHVKSPEGILPGKTA